MMFLLFISISCSVVAGSLVNEGDACSRECDVMPSPGNNTQFYLCKNGKYLLTNCICGMCAIQALGLVKEGVDCPRECDTRPYPGDNAQFYLCKDGKYLLDTCDEGFTYTYADADRQGYCNKRCTRREGEGCTNGQKQFNPEDKRQFTWCVGGVWYDVNCPTGSVYSNTSGLCEAASIDLEGINCLRECDTRRYPGNDLQFYLCKDGKYLLTRCIEGFTYTYLDDEHQGYCNKRCARREGENCTNGQKQFNPEDKRQFIWCVGGVWYDVNCPTGSVYSNTSGLCEVELKPVPPSDCGFPSPCPNNEKFPDLCDCTKFYECHHVSVVRRDCGPGTAFNPQTGDCDWPKNVELCRTLKYSNRNHVH